MIKILLTALLMAASSAASSGPSFLFKIGGLNGDNNNGSTSGKVRSSIVSLRPDDCINSCISANFTRLSTQHGDYAGIGLDYEHKLENGFIGDFRIIAGIVIFDERLNFGERVNIHLGLSLRLYESKKLGIHLAYDHYSNGKERFNRQSVVFNVPVDVFSIGVTF